MLNLQQTKTKWHMTKIFEIKLYYITYSSPTPTFLIFLSTFKHKIFVLFVQILREKEFRCIDLILAYLGLYQYWANEWDTNSLLRTITRLIILLAVNLIEHKVSYNEQTTMLERFLFELAAQLIWQPKGGHRITHKRIHFTYTSQGLNFGQINFPKEIHS